MLDQERDKLADQAHQIRQQSAQIDHMTEVCGCVCICVFMCVGTSAHQFRQQSAQIDHMTGNEKFQKWLTPFHPPDIL